MEQPSKLLPGGLIVALPDARLDRQDPLADDSPALNERFVVKVLAGVERVAEIHSQVHQLDDGDGPAEALGRLRDPAVVSRRIPKPWAQDSMCISRRHGTARPNDIVDQSPNSLRDRGTNAYTKCALVLSLIP